MSKKFSVGERVRVDIEPAAAAPAGSVGNSVYGTVFGFDPEDGAAVITFNDGYTWVMRDTEIVKYQVTALII